MAFEAGTTTEDYLPAAVGGAARGFGLLQVPNRGQIRLCSMGKLGAFVGSTIGSYAGWYAGAHFGFTTAFMVSMVGTGFGLYYGRKIALSYVE